jgi:hypothetical protein
MTTTIKQKKHQKRVQKRAAAKRRKRAVPSPGAFAFTVHDSQVMGGPGKTKLYELDKARKERGEKGLLFKDEAGRTMVFGDVLRALLNVVKEEVIA